VDDLLQTDSPLLDQLQAGLERALVRVELRRVRTLPLPTLESHALQLGAIELMHRSTRADFDRVGDMLEHLIDRHGRVASPHAWRAKWHMLRLTRGLVSDPAAETRAALEHTQRAVDADPDCAMALAMEGMIHCQFRRDLDRAAATLERATVLGPHEALAWLFKGVVHAFRDEGEPARDSAEQALRLAPMDPMRYFFDSLAAASVLAAGAHGRAIELAQRSLRANAGHSSTYRTLAIAQVCSGQVEEARQTVRRLLAVEPGFSIARFQARVPQGLLATRFARALAEAGVPVA
jgi:tetratricopeptide (TPR) repeat protein